MENKNLNSERRKPPYTLNDPEVKVWLSKVGIEVKQELDILKVYGLDTANEYTITEATRLITEIMEEHHIAFPFSIRTQDWLKGAGIIANYDWYKADLFDQRFRSTTFNWYKSIPERETPETYTMSNYLMDKLSQTFTQHKPGLSGIEFAKISPSAYDGLHTRSVYLDEFSMGFWFHKPRRPQDGRLPGETSAEYFIRMASMIPGTTGIQCKSVEESTRLFQEMKKLRDPASNFLIIGGVSRPGKSLPFSLFDTHHREGSFFSPELGMDSIKEKIKDYIKIKDFKDFKDPYPGISNADIPTDNQPFYKNIGKKGGNKKRKGGRTF